jgi:hypothetical protein
MSLAFVIDLALNYLFIKSTGHNSPRETVPSKFVLLDKTLQNLKLYTGSIVD